MNKYDILKHYCALKNYPFTPEVGGDDMPIKRDLFLATLNPNEEPRLVTYYHDVYDWSKGNLIQGLSKSNNGFDQFPVQFSAKPNDSILILLVGYKLSGSRSLRELMYYKIKSNSNGKKLLKIDFEFTSNNVQSNLKSLARTLILAYSKEKDVSADERKSYLDIVATAEGENVFNEIKQVVVDEFIYIFYLTGVDRFDFWKSVFNSIKGLANYVVINTGNEQHATICYEHIQRNGGNISLIKARKLNKSRAIKIIEQRFKEERTKQDLSIDNLWPFTEDFINGLFEKSPNAPDQSEIEYPIGWIKKTLMDVLEKHLKHCEENKITDKSAVRISDEVARNYRTT